MIKKLRWKLISIKQNNNEIISWFFIQSFKNWILLHYNPVDYILDGYIFIPLQTIQAYKHTKEEKFKEKVILSNNKIINNSLWKTKNIIKYLTKKKIYVSIERKKNQFYMGIIIESNKKNITLRAIKPSGERGNTEKIKIKQIKNIMFDSDYINCLSHYSETISSL